MLALGDREIPLPLISQYLGRLRDGVVAGAVPPKARDLILANVGLVLDDYASATDVKQAAPSGVAGGARPGVDREFRCSGRRNATSPGKRRRRLTSLNNRPMDTLRTAQHVPLQDKLGG